MHALCACRTKCIGRPRCGHVQGAFSQDNNKKERKEKKKKKNSLVHVTSGEEEKNQTRRGVYYSHVFDCQKNSDIAAAAEMRTYKE